MGAGLLAPWNALLTAADYYAAVFPPGSHVERTLTLCYLPTCLALLALTAYWPSRFPSPYARVWAAYAAFALLMAGLAVADAFSPPAVLRVAGVAALVGVFDGLCQGAVFGGAAADMPASYLHATVGGTSASGLLVCLMRMATKAALPATPEGLRRSVGVYFGLAALISASCLGAHALALPRLPVVRWHRAEAAAARRRRRRRTPAAQGGGTLGGGGPAAATHGGGKPTAEGAAAEAEIELSPKSRAGGSGSNGGGGRRVSVNGGDLNGGSPAPPPPASASATAPLLLPHSPPSSPPPAPTPPNTLQQHLGAGAGDLAGSSGDSNGGVGGASASAPSRPSRALARRALVPCLALVSVYVVSLSIFPGVLGEDLSDPKLGGWYPLVLFFAFNAGDLLGKNLPLGGARFERRATDAVLLALALGRAAVFFPAYVAARALGAPSWAVAHITLALGLSNGFLTACLMTIAPRRLAAAQDARLGGGEDAEAVENLLVIALVVGLLLGAMASWLWVV